MYRKSILNIFFLLYIIWFLIIYITDSESIMTKTRETILPYFQVVGCIRFLFIGLTNPISVLCIITWKVVINSLIWVYKYTLLIFLHVTVNSILVPRNWLIHPVLHTFLLIFLFPVSMYPNCRERLKNSGLIYIEIFAHSLIFTV